MPIKADLSDYIELLGSIGDVDTSGFADGYVLTYSTATGLWEAAAPPGAGGGEANTLTSVGAGASLYKTKVGVDLRIRSIVGGTGITATQNADDVTLDLNTPLTGLVIGTDVQAYDLNLTEIAALAPTDGAIIVGNGTSNWAIETGATARTSLGLGTGDSPQFAGVDIGGVADLTQDGTDLTLSATGEIILDGLTGLTIDGNNVTNQPVIRVTNMGAGNSGVHFVRGSQRIAMAGSMDWASPFGFATTNKGLRYSVTGFGDATLASHHFSHDANSSANQLAVMGVRNANNNSLMFQAEQTDGTVIFSVDYNGAIEIGHASDTTLSRTSAGVLAVEGVELTQNTKAQTLTNKTLGDVLLTGAIGEEVFTIPSSTTPELDPADGTVQKWTLTGASTPTEVFADGESITLMIDDGTAYAITWPTMTWVNNGGVAPTLATTGFTTVTLWHFGTLYGALVGDGT